MDPRQTHTSNTSRGAQAPRGGLRPWLKLAAGVAAVLFFIFGIGTLASRLPGARHMAEVIEEHDLRATAIFYTDFKESSEGSAYIRDCLQFPPGRMTRPE